MPDPQYREIKDLVKDLRQARNLSSQDWGGVVFWIGAGCSRSAEIPLASEIAQTCVREFAHKLGSPKFRNADKALKWLREKEHIDKGWSLDKISWGNLYGDIFQARFNTAVDQHEIILEAINKGNGKINWAHLCLGELVRQRYIHTVLTTNFDQLVLQGIINTGILPVVADGVGVDSLAWITSRPKRPQVIHLHGSMHTYKLINSKKATKKAGNAPLLKGMLQQLLLHNRMLVIVGYAGGEEGVMKQLIEVVNVLRDTMVYWVMYEDNYSSLSKQARRLLAIGDNKYVIQNRDADELFADTLFSNIMDGLEIGAPEWMRQPTSHIHEQSKNLASSKDELIQKNIRSYQEKVQRLDELWKMEEEAREEVFKLLDVIPKLQLEGKYEKALIILQKHKGSNNHEIWRMHAETAYELGQRSSNQHVSKKYLKESIEAWKRVLLLLAQENTRDWCEAQIGLGHALVLLYDLDHKQKYLEEAVSVYSAASEGNTWMSTPSNLAETQANLGSALQTLGELEDDTDRLFKSIKAYERALKVYTRKNSPREWARTEDHRGGALLALGSIKEDIRLLEKAVVAFQGALDFYSEADEMDLNENRSNKSSLKSAVLPKPTRYLIESIEKNLKQVQMIIKTIKGKRKR